MFKFNCSVAGTISIISILFFPQSVLAEDHMISQSGDGFSDIFLTVKINDKINFVNHDSSVHNVTRVTKSSKENFGVIKPGEKQVMSFSTPGVYEVLCNLHEGKKMTVFVKQSVAGNL